MPLEIRELHIKVTVNQPQGSSSAQQPSDNNNNGDEKETLISQCVEQVMELINNKKER
jgi:hypothetical protein